jgi:FlaA1/EpsC-like NDP-sugar epimerase
LPTSLALQITMSIFDFFRSVISRLQLQSQIFKFAVVAIVDLLALILAVLCAYVLRVSSLELPPVAALPLYVVGPVLSVFLAAITGAYQSVTRTYTTDTELKIIRSQIFVLPLWALFLVTFGVQGFARSVVVIYIMIAVLIMVGIRRSVAALMHDNQNQAPKQERIPVLIYGAGREGVALVDGLRRQGRYKPVAFIETDYTLLGRTVAGLPVLSIDKIVEIMTRFKPREVMVAKPKQSRANRKALVEKLVGSGLVVKTIPDLTELADGRFDLGALRPIKLEDLLGRDPVPPVKNLMDKAIKDQIILVTGAGGSIGSELVRQVADCAPRKIIMVDNSEYALFEINREMEQKFANLDSRPQLTAVLADISDEKRIASIFLEQRPDVVFHAAAYKHVRMVQENAAVGLRNNIWGTKITAEAAIRANVRLFVLISTDKAVRPTSIMGASKRVAEMVVQGLARNKKIRTVFAIVRFGNVLGSTGSVVPLFRSQIARGGPVTVTHPDVTRYFMLIPEAAQLVIQAGAMASGGDVFVLDMGESVKIVDLATTMIEIEGMTPKTADNPHGDIEIVFTGLVEGEKLYEELQIGRDIVVTSHERVMRSQEFSLHGDELNRELSSLSTALEKNRLPDAKALLFKLALLGS